MVIVKSVSSGGDRPTDSRKQGIKNNEWVSSSLWNRMQRWQWLAKIYVGLIPAGSAPRHKNRYQGEWVIVAHAKSDQNSFKTSCLCKHAWSIVLVIFLPLCVFKPLYVFLHNIHLFTTNWVWVEIGFQEHELFLEEPKLEDSLSSRACSCLFNGCKD